MLQQMPLGSSQGVITETSERKFVMPTSAMFSPYATAAPSPMDLSRFLNLCYASNGGVQPMMSAMNAGPVLAPRFPFPMQGAFHPQVDSLPGVPQFPFMHSSLPNMLASLQACAQMQLPNQQAPSNAQAPKFAVSNQAAPSRKRSMSSDDDTESASSNGEPSPKSNRAVKRERLEVGEENSEMGLGGESRLKINFLNLGNPGKHPQVFGKSRLGVPDRLSGTYVLYSERWRSEIVHEDDGYQADDGTQHVLVTWKITNLTSGVTQSRTETVREAILRHKDGRTLCNKVFRKALEHRAQELEEEVKKETNPIRVKTMKNLIKKLRPKHFSEGPLVFGLRHECVQNRFKTMTTLDTNGFLITKDSVQEA